MLSYYQSYFESNVMKEAFVICNPPPPSSKQNKKKSSSLFSRKDSYNRMGQLMKQASFVVHVELRGWGLDLSINCSPVRFSTVLKKGKRKRLLSLYMHSFHCHLLLSNGHFDQRLITVPPDPLLSIEFAQFGGHISMMLSF